MKLPALFLLLPLVACGQNPAQQAEVLWKQGRYKEAGAAFSAAVKADPKNPALRVRWGLLLLERFNPGEASDLFNEALEIQKDFPPALLGLARVYAEDFEQRAVGYAQRALEKDPEFVEARELYANLLLEDRNDKAAAAEALKIQSSKNALAVLAAIDLLQDKDASQWLTKMGPHAEGYARIARHFVLNRRYEEAIANYRKALEIDPGMQKARSELGINLMRVGEDAEARQVLVQAYEAGYTNAATANSLKVLDSYKNFIVYKEPRFVLRLHKNEAALLRPYFTREMSRALQTYDRKYGVKLPGPVTVEVYPDHEDFAVRTMGMPGLGALGVTFGLSVAMDSPSARKPGSFHWASTLWHELSHVYVLAATNHRVPRWFTEGLAVHEETATDPEWGDRLSPEIIAAMKKNLLLPIAQLDRGFIRPSYRAQVVVSYFQAGRTCDYIQSRWGWDKLLEMIRAFSHVTTTAEVVESALGMKPEQFDKEFFEWLSKQHEAPLKNFEEWSKSIKPLNEALKAKNWDEVSSAAPKLITEYPDYVEAGNAYEALAEARIAKNDNSGAIKALESYAGHGGRNPATLKHLASLYEAAGNNNAAEQALRRLLWIYPVRDEELHRKLGTLRASLGVWEGSAEEWQAVLESRTVDRAGAHYEIARAYQHLNRNEDAKDAVLAALEEVPGYRPAQRLLLELNKTELPKKE